MGDVVNLNRVRKEQERRRRQDRAAENRVRHGRSKAEKQQESRDSQRQSRLLDGHRRDEPPMD